RQERRQRELAAEAVVGYVRRERRLSPRLGGRKLYYLLGQELQAAFLTKRPLIVSRPHFFDSCPFRALSTAVWPVISDLQKQFPLTPAACLELRLGRNDGAAHAADSRSAAAAAGIG